VNMSEKCDKTKTRLKEEGRDLYPCIEVDKGEEGKKGDQAKSLPILVWPFNSVHSKAGYGNEVYRFPLHSPHSINQKTKYNHLKKSETNGHLHSILWLRISRIALKPSHNTASIQPSAKTLTLQKERNHLWGKQKPLPITKFLHILFPFLTYLSRQ